ncbi:helix-turn-helix transcriptional regulator [Streptomyces sp. NPDC005574]|uniref:helix-turn-helix domain-containing protein n=1 Tax=Streptomyces sp. NPDC005574 TaxID=3156891 RepID=UPI0033BE4365
MASSQKAVPARALRHTAVISEESARLARALIEFREAEGISERELARRTWLSEATIRTFEVDRGGLPTPTVARSFEEVLGWAPGSIKATPSETMSREPSADSAIDLE